MRCVAVYFEMCGCVLLKCVAVHYEMCGCALSYVWLCAFRCVVVSYSFQMCDSVLLDVCFQMSGCVLS